MFLFQVAPPAHLMSLDKHETIVNWANSITKDKNDRLLLQKFANWKINSGQWEVKDNTLKATGKNEGTSPKPTEPLVNYLHKVKNEWVIHNAPGAHLLDEEEKPPAPHTDF